MRWLLTSHVRRYHRRYHTGGHVWQGRFKAFPIEEDEHLWSVLRIRFGPCLQFAASKLYVGEWKTGREQAVGPGRISLELVAHGIDR